MIVIDHRDLVFVGQGPNESSWKDNLERSAKYGGGDAFAIRLSAKLALSGRAGDRIGSLMDMSGLDFFYRFNRANLNDRFNGKSGKGDKFLIPEGRLKAAALLATYKRFVLFGKSVARCFGVESLEFCQSGRIGHQTGIKSVLVMPHPSGLSRWWNDETNTARAREALVKFVSETGNR